MTPLTLRQADSGRTVSLAVGATLIIELAENATTGHRWTAPEFDAGVLALVSSDMTPAASGALGAGGVRQFEFSGKTSGTSAIRSDYRRASDTASAPAAHFEVTVTVSG